MIVIKVAASHNFTILPSELEATICRIRKGGTGIVDDYAIADFTVDRYYLDFSVDFQTEEGVFYDMTILNGTDIVYKDKLFATDQTVADYSINDGKYTPHNSDNTFVIHE